MNLIDRTIASLTEIMTHYQDDFTHKQYADTLDDTDTLMNTFGISPSLKSENKQYWGRQLGKCWELLVVSLCENLCDDFKPPMRVGSDVPCDLILGRDAIDTKYRIGSGDSGTLKKFKNYARILIERDFNPVMLVVREDNLPSAITAAKTGGWEILTGQDSFNYIHEQTTFDIQAWLQGHVQQQTFYISRGTDE